VFTVQVLDLSSEVQCTDMVVFTCLWINESNCYFFVGDEAEYPHMTYMGSRISRLHDPSNPSRWMHNLYVRLRRGSSALLKYLSLIEAGK